MNVKNQSLDQKSIGQKKLLWISGVATFGAILTHIYLLIEHFNLKFGQTTGSSLCDINELFSCSTIAASRFSEFLGVPMALWGVLVNGLLLILISMWPFVEPDRKSLARRNLLLLSGFTVGTSLVMGSISIFALSKLCPFCIMTYVLSVVILTAFWVGSKEQQSPTASKSIFENFHFSDIKPLLIGGVVVFVGGFIIDNQVRNSYGAKNMDAFVQSQVQEWLSNPELQLNVIDPLVKGSPADQSIMTITEFADYRCIHCKHAAPTLKAFVSSHQNVRLQYQAWPLDGECNTAIPQTNGASCLLARVVLCAEQLAGKGWSTQYYLFEHQEDLMAVSSIQERLPEIANSANLTEEKIKACIDDLETKKMVEKQSSVGTALNLRGTPTIYVNNRQLPSGQSLPVLQEVYKYLSKNKK